MRKMRNLAVIALLSVLFFSCSKEDRGAYIPKSASVVLTFNGKAIIDEVKWDLLFGKDLLKFKSLERDTFMSKLFQNPTSTGVEFMDRAYVFVDSVAGENTKGAVIVPLSDGEQFTEFIKTNLKPNVAIKSIGSFSSQGLGGQAHLVWNENTLFLVNQKSEKEAVSYVEGLIAQKENSLLTTEFDGKAVLTGEDHIGLWANYGSIMRSLSVNLAQSGLKVDLSGKLIYAVNVNFKNGKLESNLDCYYDDKMVDFKNIMSNPNLQSVSSHVDASNSLAFAAMAISFKAIPSMLEKYGIKSMAEMSLQNMGISLDTLCNSLGNNLSINFDGVKTELKKYEYEDWTYSADANVPPVMTKMEDIRPEHTPNICAALSVNDTSYIKNLLRKFLGRFPGATANYFPIGEAGSIFFKDKTMYYAFDSLQAATIVAGTANFKNDVLKDKAGVVYLNFKGMSQKLPVQQMDLIWVPVFEKYFAKVSMEGNVPTANFSRTTLVVDMVNKNDNFILSVINFAKELESLFYAKRGI